MSGTALTKPPSAMTRREAEACVQRIRSHFADARAAVLGLYERQGWKALGYDSWRACVVAEFEQSQTHLYRLLTAARIEREISPTGELGVIPERVLRPLGGVKDAEDRRAIYEEAVQVAGGGIPTESIVRDLLTPDDLDLDSAEHFRELQDNEDAAAEFAEEDAEETAEQERQRRISQGIQKIGEAIRKFKGVEGGLPVAAILERAEREARGLLGE